jgi:hypothetical protein
MNTIINIILILVIGQLATITHEFGHAIPVLVFTKSKVKIILGKNSTKSKIINFKRLNIAIGGFSPFTGFVHWNASEMTKIQKLIATVGGPIVSLIIAIFLYLLSINVKHNIVSQILYGSAGYNLIQFIITIIPITYPTWWGEYRGHKSDGYKALLLIKNT